MLGIVSAVSLVAVLVLAGIVANQYTNWYTGNAVFGPALKLVARVAQHIITRTEDAVIRFNEFVYESMREIVRVVYTAVANIARTIRTLGYIGAVGAG